MDSDPHNSRKQKPPSNKQGDNRRSTLVQDAALNFIKQLREADPIGFKPPEVTLIDKRGAKPQTQVSRRLHEDAALNYVRKLRKSDPKPQERPNVAVTDKTGDEIPAKAALGCSDGVEHRMSRFSSLPPSDSPLTTVFLGQYVSSLIQETIAYLKLSYGGLAHEMSIPEMVLRDAVAGKLGLIRGQWVKLGGLLSLPTTYELRPGERDGSPCWEVCYPPVPFIADKE